MFGDNFYLVETGVSDEEKKMVSEFEKAYKSSKLKEFFEKLLSSGQFKSTFKKDPTKQKSPEEIAKSKALVDKQIDILSDQFDTIEKQVEELKAQDMSSVVSKAKSFITP
jgi:ABC-type phosphate transport system auxiliary subunit